MPRRDLPLQPSSAAVQVRKRDPAQKGKVGIEECPYNVVDDDPNSKSADGMSTIQSVPPSAMTITTTSVSMGAREEPAQMTEASSLLGPPTFGSSFGSSDQDPYAWANNLRHIPDKVGRACNFCVRRLTCAGSLCSTLPGPSVACC